MQIPKLTHIFLCLSLISTTVTAQELQGNSDSISYERIRTTEVSVALRDRFNSVTRVYPEERGSYYHDLYINQFLRLKSFLEQEAFIFNDTFDTYVGDMIHALNQALDTPVTDPVFLITESPVANARALGLGFIEIYYGLFRILEHQDELAFVLAHELAHEYFDHQRLSVDTRSDFFEQKELQRQMRKTMAGDTSSVGARALRNRIYNTMRFSRQYESMADSLAFVMMQRCGYDPAYAESALRALQHHTEPDSAFASHVQSLFTFDSLSFDQAWWQPVTPNNIPMVLLFYSKDSLNTHPPINERLKLVRQLLEEWGILMDAEDVDTSMHQTLGDLKKRSKEYTFKLFQNSDNPYFCLYESLRWLRRAPDDSTALVLTAQLLYDLYIFQLKNKYHLVGPRPHPNYPQDFNALLSFLHNIPKQSLGQICLQFHSRIEDLLPQGVLLQRRGVLEHELKDLTYREWRLEVKRKRQEKRKQREAVKKQ